MQEVSKLFGCVSHDRTHIYPGEGGGGARCTFSGYKCGFGTS